MGGMYGQRQGEEGKRRNDADVKPKKKDSESTTEEVTKDKKNKEECVTWFWPLRFIIFLPMSQVP